MVKLLNILISFPVIILPVAMLSVKPVAAEMVSAHGSTRNSRKKRGCEQQMRGIAGLEECRAKAICGARRDRRCPAPRAGGSQRNGRFRPGGWARRQDARCATTAEIYDALKPPALPWQRPTAPGAPSFRSSRKAAQCAFLVPPVPPQSCATRFSRAAHSAGFSSFRPPISSKSAAVSSPIRGRGIFGGPCSGLRAKPWRRTAVARSMSP